MRGRILPYGAEAVLVEVDGLPEVLGLKAALGTLTSASRESRNEWGVIDTIVGARTLLVCADAWAVPGLPRKLARVLADAQPRDLRVPSHTYVVPVTYDGPDLADVARLTGLTEADVVEAHTGTTWISGFNGFTPGFAYLVHGDPRLVVPRRPTPRTEVAGGSVALAGGYSAIYPRAGPGGWQVIGHTDFRPWVEGTKGEPDILAPGVAVRFEVAP